MVASRVKRKIPRSRPAEPAAKKKILFLTGTRADFGKLKPLISAVDDDQSFEVFIFITGMHMLPEYGSTWMEVKKCGFKNIFTYINQKGSDSMDVTLSRTIEGLSGYVSAIRPDLIVVHGDRGEALAGVIVGAFNNILVAHIEGGEVSGTIDESIRHSVSKLAHLHFVSNAEARKRLLQLGEKSEQIHVIGSPEMDLMLSPKLPKIKAVKKAYDIPFDHYSLLIYHPVTTSLVAIRKNAQLLADALIESGLRYVAVNTNNDTGADLIREVYEKRLKNNANFRIFPSIRFENFLVLLKNCDFIIGNSSCGVREAPFYSRPSINIGTRQDGRARHSSIISVSDSKREILEAIDRALQMKVKPSRHYGDGKSASRFLRALRSPALWKTPVQKRFLDIM